jgi:hypothetical protein
MGIFIQGYLKLKNPHIYRKQRLKFWRKIRIFQSFHTSRKEIKIPKICFSNYGIIFMKGVVKLILSAGIALSLSIARWQEFLNFRIGY